MMANKKASQASQPTSLPSANRNIEELKVGEPIQMLFVTAVCQNTLSLCMSVCALLFHSRNIIAGIFYYYFFIVMMMMTTATTTTTTTEWKNRLLNIHKIYALVLYFFFRFALEFSRVALVSCFFLCRTHTLSIHLSLLMCVFVCVRTISTVDRVQRQW